MKTQIYPDAQIAGKEHPVSGFYVGKEFVCMSPHKGHVGLLPIPGMRYRFCKGGNNKNALYAGQHYELVLRGIEEPVAQNEIMRVVASQGQRLVILDNRKREAE